MTAVFSLVYAAITVVPVICHHSPYTPFSAPAWYIPRKTALAVVNTVDCVMDFLGKYSSFVCSRKYWTIPSLREKVLSYRKLLPQDMTEAAHDAAKRTKNQLDARALGWTLNQLDEEGELVKSAMEFLGFPVPPGLKEPCRFLRGLQSSAFVIKIFISTSLSYSFVRQNPNCCMTRSSFQSPYDNSARRFAS